jgi:shikimate kinase
MSRVLLIGMMGAGKSSVGHAIEAATGWPYRDNDEIVETLTGLPTQQLMEQRGVPAMRAAEAEALDQALTAPEPLVAGVAGGTVESPELRERLRSSDAFVVYLSAPVEVLLGRVGSGAGRPFLQPAPGPALRHLYNGRDPLYREVADLVVDTTDGGAAEQARRVLDALGYAEAGGSATEDSGGA